MGWRYASYTEGESSLAFRIEPMAEGSDRVHVPDEAAWMRTVPPWARERRGEILGNLRSMGWNRELVWNEGDLEPILDPLAFDIPGDVESTPGGRLLQSMNLFDPGSGAGTEGARETWHEAVRKCVEQARGEVRVHASEVIPGSVFERIVLPGLRANPNVTVKFA